MHSGLRDRCCIAYCVTWVSCRCCDFCWESWRVTTTNVSKAAQTKAGLDGKISRGRSRTRTKKILLTRRKNAVIRRGMDLPRSVRFTKRLLLLYFLIFINFVLMSTQFIYLSKNYLYLIFWTFDKKFTSWYIFWCFRYM